MGKDRLSITSGVAIALVLAGSLWAAEPARERSAMVRLGPAKPVKTSRLVLCRLYQTGPHVREELAPYVTLRGGRKTAFSEMASVIFAPTRRTVRGRAGEYEVTVDIILRTGGRVSGLLDREDATTVSLGGDGLKVHLSTEEWLGHSIEAEFELE